MELSSVSPDCEATYLTQAYLLPAYSNTWMFFRAQISFN
jgi:hypothetical protein